MTRNTTEVGDGELVEVQERQCDNCNQWYKEGETEWTTYTKEAEARCSVSDELTFEKLLEVISAFEIIDKYEMRDLQGNSHIGSFEMTEAKPIIALKKALNNFYESTGGPARPTDNDLLAARGYSNRSAKELERGDFVFKLEPDTEVVGDEIRVCEHCEEVMFNG